jgi:hypothetical protein
MNHIQRHVVNPSRLQHNAKINNAPSLFGREEEWEMVIRNFGRRMNMTRLVTHYCHTTFLYLHGTMAKDKSEKKDKKRKEGEPTRDPTGEAVDVEMVDADGPKVSKPCISFSCP